MRRVVLILILALTACRESSEITSTGLEPGDASLVAVIKPGASKTEVHAVVKGVTGPGSGAVEARANYETGLFLVKFRDGVTREQRARIVNMVASSGLFTSINCPTCPSPSPTPG
jgi:hypothetical protein